ncbi:hypothetical protein Vi05172_g8183 [Venturia inaequalis]|nr:hypothetical protein Vi05172_g8183 [Venturia inaequalis]
MEKELKEDRGANPKIPKKSLQSSQDCKSYRGPKINPIEDFESRKPWLSRRIEMAKIGCELE